MAVILSRISYHIGMYFNNAVRSVSSRDVTDSESKSDGILHFSWNPKSVRYLKSNRNRFEIFVSVQLYNYFHNTK